MEYKIDATNKVLGRLASEVAVLLRGKNSTSFDPAKLSGNKITVYNTDKIYVTGRKMTQKLYRHHTMFHGGLKEEMLKDLLRRDSRLAIKTSVSGMLPKNKLRAKLMKNLILVKGDQ